MEEGPAPARRICSTCPPASWSAPAPATISAEQFPDRWTSGDFTAELSYRFEPGTATDGVTVADSAAGAERRAAAGLDWQVPGLRAELVTALLRTLPKHLRRAVVPIPDTAAALVAALPSRPRATGAPG